MNERKLSELQKEYRLFFLEKMSLYGVRSPAELTKEKKSEFFTEIKHDWTKFKLARRQEKEANKRTIQTTPEKSLETFPRLSVWGTGTAEVKKQKDEKLTAPERIPNEERIFSSPYREEIKTTPREFPKQIIKSEPNKEQTTDLRILFNPNSYFVQEENYSYPVVKMPVQNSLLKLPRVGRSDQKGYTEDDFYRQIKLQLTDIEATSNVHMVIPNSNQPYEPDIVLFDKALNLYIDIEIDEPYDGYYRYPTHYTSREEEVKRDDIRDLFFTESGWIVIRFSEKQVHCQTDACLDYIRNALNSIYNRDFITEPKCESEEQWDYNQCIHWQKIFYREKYLGINRFYKRNSLKEIEINLEGNESIENVIVRTKQPRSECWNLSVAFDEKTHKYSHPKDETGNADYLSVTTLIERFFPFDLNRYIEKKATAEGKTEEEIFDEYSTMRDEAALKGTELHKQIEDFLKENKVPDHSSNEFGLFRQFHKQEISTKNLEFYDAERPVVSYKYNVAGTIDCLFKKRDCDEYVMMDWKRSKNLTIDGHPRKFGFGYALSELNHLDNSSYYRYCLQQNLYKYIIENEEGKSISSMWLIVLHEDFSTFYKIKVPVLTGETKIILNSLRHKI